MRLTTVLLIATMMQVCAASYAQKISLKEKNAPLEKIFNQIRLQSGYDFLFNKNLLKNAKPVDIDIKDALLDEVLKLCFANQPFTYTLQEKTIVVKAKETSLVNVILNLFQDLKGRVTDEQGKPLPNASIRIKGKSDVTNTDANGMFEIKGVENDAVLQVSYVGYKTLEIALKDAVMPLEIKLNPQTGELQEVKVTYNTGYQELDLQRSTGSVVQIDNKLFNRQLGSDVLSRITNITSGLSDNVGPLGVSHEITVRGKSTINGLATPLIVLDNFPYGSSLSSINPNDIESITVLKDAAAAAIWGTRAGNGVIVITTKKGKYNAGMKLAVEANATIRNKPDLFYIPRADSKSIIEYEKYKFEKGVYDYYDDLYPEFGIFPLIPLSIETLLKAKKDGIIEPTKNPIVLKALDELGNHDIRNDLKKYMIRNEFAQQYAINMSGGMDKYAYYASVGFDQSSPYEVTSNSKRFTINFDNTYKISNRLEVAAKLMYTMSNNHASPTSYNSFLSNFGVSPYARLADEKGNALVIPYGYRKPYIDTASYPALFDWHYKPLEDMYTMYNTSKLHEVMINTSAKYKVFSWLRAEVHYQRQSGLTRLKQVKDANSFFVRNGINRTMTTDPSGKIIYPWPMGDYIRKQDSSTESWSARGSLSVDKQAGPHRIIGIIGIEKREFDTETSGYAMYGYNNNTGMYTAVNPLQQIPTRPPDGLSVQIGQPEPIGGFLQRNGSVFSNVAYSFVDRYFLSISGRIDQSNSFGLTTNLRKTPLWSAGISWAINDEQFYKMEWLPYLKLRASYGFTGNATGSTSFPTIQYYPGEPNGNAPFRGIDFAQFVTPGNPGLRWERVKIINIGADFRSKNDRITGSIDIYTKRGLDLLGQVQLDPTSGWEQYRGNGSHMNTTGGDVVLNTNNLQGREFRWNSTLLFSYNKTKIISNLEGTDPSNLVANAQAIVGYPLYSMFSFKWAGLDPSDGSPRIYVGDKIVNLDDPNFNSTNIQISELNFHGSITPEYFGSFMNTFSWKDISLSFNISYKFKYCFRRTSVDYMNLVNGGWNTHKDFELRWKNKGDEVFTNVPSLPEYASYLRQMSYSYSDLLVEKGDHVRLKDIRLNYTLNDRWLKGKNVNALNIFMYASNLGVLWRANKYGIDPDAYLFGDYPQPKSFSLGLSITL